MNVEPSLITNSQSAVVVEPRQCALDYPSVPAQPLSALHATSGYSGSNAPLTERFPTPCKVVPFISVQLGWSLAPTSAKLPRLLDGFDSINHISEGIAVMNVGCSTDYRKGNSLSVDHKMALRARFSFIRRIRPGSFAPFLALTVAESTAARDQSIFPASPNLSKRTWCSFSHTPAFCQSRSLRQQVMPLPQPISGGSMSQWMPVLNTNKIPVSAALFGTLGLPPFGFGGSRGSRGSITFHSSSVSISFAIP